MTIGASKWPLQPLGELVDILDSRRVPVSAKERLRRPGEVPYYGASGPVGTIDQHIFDEPLLLLGEDGVQFFDSSKSKSYLIEGPAWVNNHAHVLRARPSVERKFLNYYLNHCDYRGFANGTTRLKLTQAAMRQIPVPLPPIDEQRSIIKVLDSRLSRLVVADRGLALSLAKLKGLRERTITHALTGADVPERVAADLPDVGTSDGDLPSLPLGWAWARLGGVADVVGGITKDAKKQGDPSFVQVPYLRVANVQRGHLKLDVVTQIRADPEKAKSLRLEYGDVLLNEGGDRDKLARGWVWEGQIAECIHQNHVFRARLHEPRLNPYFLSWIGNTFGGRWAEQNGKQSVNLASISLRMIKQMPVIVPAPGEAERIAASLRDQLDSYDRLELGLKSARSASSSTEPAEAPARAASDRSVTEWCSRPGLLTSRPFAFGRGRS